MTTPMWNTLRSCNSLHAIPYFVSFETKGLWIDDGKCSDLFVILQQQIHFCVNACCSIVFVSRISCRL